MFSALNRGYKPLPQERSKKGSNLGYTNSKGIAILPFPQRHVVLLSHLRVILQRL
jgi:hypothetical protein